MDFLPTKGIEYLMVIGYLLLLIPFWWSLRRRAVAPAEAAVQPATAGGWRGWFTVPDGLAFHRGHTWAVPEGGGVFRVGMDDFAAKLLGRPEALELPAAGARLEQGERGWRVRVDGHELDLLSPVQGRVEAVNLEAAVSPEVVTSDPYGRGWLLKVRVPHEESTLKNLLPARLAREWMNEAAAALSRLMSPELGAVLQDGGVPVDGFGRHLGSKRWHELAAELLMTSSASGRGGTPGRSRSQPS